MPKFIYEFAFLEYFDMSVVSNLLIKEGICTKLLNTGRILPALWNASSLDYSYLQLYGIPRQSDTAEQFLPVTSLLNLRSKLLKLLLGKRFDALSLSQC